ncbi:hypothetical protein Tco_1298673, partial [Tanacetum coccineum]
MTPHHVPLGFGSITGGLDHVNPVIRLPLECGISRVLGLGIMEMEPDIKNMTLNEMQRKGNYRRMFDPEEVQQITMRQILTLFAGIRDSDFDKILDDLFRIGADNLKRMGPYIFQDSICEQDVDLEEDQEED